MGPHKPTLLTVFTKRGGYSTNTRLYPTSDILLLNIHWFQYGSTSQSLIPVLRYRGQQNNSSGVLSSQLVLHDGVGVRRIIVAESKRRAEESRGGEGRVFHL